jgi:transcriptional regulator with XRE-family HTH domain
VVLERAVIVNRQEDPMDASPIQLGVKIRQLRYQLGLTQRQVAQRLGGHFVERDIQRIETGHAGWPSPQLLEALLPVLGQDLHSFFSDQPIEPVAVSIGATSAASIRGSVPWSEGAMLPDLTQARNRLHLAMQSSQAACRHSRELLHASRQLSGLQDPQSNIEAPNRGSMMNAP